MVGHRRLMLPVYSCVSLRTPVFTCVQLCIPAYTRVHPRTAVYPCIHPCSPAFTRVHPRTPAFTRVHPRTPASTCIHLRTPVFTCVHPCSRVHLHTPANDLLGGGLSSQLFRTFSLVLSVGNEVSASIVPELNTATITITDVSCKLHRNPQPHPLDAKDMCSLKFLGYAAKGVLFHRTGFYFLSNRSGFHMCHNYSAL